MAKDLYHPRRGSGMSPVVEEKEKNPMENTWEHKHVIKEAFKNAYEKGKHKKLAHSLCKFMEELEGDEMMKLKDDFMLELHEIAYGKHFDEYTAKKLVSSMENVDGTTGEHWSLSETKEIMEKYGYVSKTGKYNECDFYVILNMMWSDYREVLGTEKELYLGMTNAYFNGPDEREGKAWVRMSPQLFERDCEEEPEEED